MGEYRANVSDNDQFHLESFTYRGVPYRGFKAKQPFVKGQDEGVIRQAIQQTAPNAAGGPLGIPAEPIDGE